MQKEVRGFTLIEILVSLAIIAVLATLSAIMILPARTKARDTARISALNGLGRYLWASQCYAPTNGPGDYDLQVIYTEFIAANPAAAALLAKAPRDPKSGTSLISGYRYLYTADGKCAGYANLENENAEVTLSTITTATAGGGTGVFQAANLGPNGSRNYYQVSR